MELVEQRNMKVATACRLFGHCRQAFYQSKADIEAEVNRDKIILDNVREIRDEDPGIGGYKLWLMLTELYGRELIPGRDSFFTLLRRHQLMLPPRKARHTTNSNHRYHKWKNLVKDIVLTSANQLWVSDITYIQLANGDVAYLHLVTDAYSRKIVGWVLADTLRAALSIQALQMAIDQAIEMNGGECLKGLIHHSDRGVQYCCDAYVQKLQEYDICSFLYLVDYIVPYSYCKLTIIFSIPNSTCQSSILFLVRIYILRLKKVHSDFLRNTPYYIYYKTLIFSALSANNQFGELAGIGLDDQDASRQGSQIEMRLTTLEVG